MMKTKLCRWGLCLMAGLVPASIAQAIDYKDNIEEVTVELGGIEEVTISMGLKTAGRLQWFDQSDAYLPAARPSDDDPDPRPTLVEDPEWGFQNAWGSMDFVANFNDLIEVYWEFFISSRPHPSEMQGSQGFILFHGLPDNALQPLFDVVDIKAGQFEVIYGDHIYRRSDNARVQRNALIGNYLVDPRSTEIGMEVMTKPGKPINALVGVTMGTESEDFNQDRGTAFHGKLWVEPSDTLRLAVSGYTVDHSDNGAGFPDGGSKNNLLSSSRSGGQYAGILDDGNAPGQVFVGKGQKVTAAQFDITSIFGPLELYANVGLAEDADINGVGEGEPEESYLYYALEAVYDFTEKFYGAARYSAAHADKIAGEDSDGIVTRIQAGLGYWLTDNILAKMEYVHQEYNDYKPGEIVSGVDAGYEPSFDGVLAEVSLAF